MTVLARTYVLSGLRFDDNFIELHEEICIGRKLCTIACPYGAISSGAVLVSLISYAVRPKYHLEKPSGRERYRDQMRYVFGRENGPACVEVYLAGAIVIVDPLHSHHKLGSRIEQEAARTFVIKFYAEAKFKRASRFSRYRRSRRGCKGRRYRYWQA